MYCINDIGVVGKSKRFIQSVEVYKEIKNNVPVIFFLQQGDVGSMDRSIIISELESLLAK